MAFMISKIINRTDLNIAEKIICILSLFGAFICLILGIIYECEKYNNHFITLEERKKIVEILEIENINIEKVEKINDKEFFDYILKLKKKKNNLADDESPGNSESENKLKIKNKK